jgi:hypothetical protein
MNNLYTEIKDFNNLRLLVNKSDQYLVIYFYPPNEKNQDYINSLINSIRSYGKRMTKLYISETTNFPGLKQTHQSICIYKNGYKLIHFYGNVGKPIIDASLQRFIAN